MFERLVLLNYQAIKELMLKNASVFQPNNLTDPFYILQWLSWHVHEYSTTPKFQTVTINSNSSSYQSELSNFYILPIDQQHEQSDYWSLSNIRGNTKSTFKAHLFVALKRNLQKFIKCCEGKNWTKVLIK